MHLFQLFSSQFWEKGPDGLTTEAFIDAVADRLDGMPFPAMREQPIEPKIDVTTEVNAVGFFTAFSKTILLR